MPFAPDRFTHADLSTLQDFFQDRLYIPLARLLDGWDEKRTRAAREAKRRYGARVVAVNDVHYHAGARRTLQDVVTAIRHGTTLKDAGNLLFSNAERRLKSAAEMSALFKDLPDALRATLDIADSCVFSPAEIRYRYPSEWIPAGETAQSYLEKLVWQGARGRYPGGTPSNVEAQLKHELKLVNELSFADYFLTIWEIVEYARQKEILCQGRGSAANSAVCYCLGITAVDPVRMNLLFERFISAERGEPPDIDVDFEHERREEVIQHIYEKYGRDRAAMVAAVITYRSRSSIREVTKVLDAPLAPAMAEELQGFPRHLSIHSGGFTLSADPLIETVPVEPARMEGRTIVQWDKDDLDAIGLLKVDVLALGMLTAIKKTCDLTKLPYAKIPAEDRATYAMIQHADTIGTFQIESRAQMNMLGRLQPRSFYDLVIQVAIVRPGPIVGKMVHPYLKRRRGIEPIDYPHPKLKPILHKTLGVPIFQEQVMKIAIELAGFTAGEADELRRAIGAWRSSGSIEKVGGRLRAGLLASGLPREWVDRVFEQIKGFAEYGFPESHAASFALLAYASAYLKCHHPAEFTCSLINSQPMGFYSSHSLVDDAKRHGVEVRAVDLNRSEWDCTIEEGALQLGLRVVSGLARVDADKLIAERRARPFTSAGDFLARVRLAPLVLQRLAMGDAFAPFGLEQRDALWEILAQAAATRPEPTGQLDLLAGVPARHARYDASDARARFASLDDYDAIRADYDAYRLSTRGHPMTAVRGKLPGLPKATSQHVRRARHGETVTMAGLVIVRQRPSTAGGTVFAALEDEHGLVDLILHKNTQERYGELFLNHSFLIAKGVAQRDAHSVSVLVRQIRAVWKEPDDLRAQSHDWH
jgi:error-prone DNA polymerase